MTYKCSFEGCTSFSKGLVDGERRCIKHGAKTKRYVCEIDGCERTVLTKLRCYAHLEKKPEKKKTYCKAEGCNKWAAKEGKCHTHYEGKIIGKKQFCKVEGCQKWSLTGGVCRAHGAVLKICTHEGCTNLIKNNQKCWQHGAIRGKCKTEGCEGKSYVQGFCYACSPIKQKHCKDHDKYMCLTCMPVLALASRIRSRFRVGLKHYGFTKSEKTVDVLGCSYAFYRQFIESKFKPNMSWENFGDWQIDHKIALFNKDEGPVTKELIIKRSHYTNTQPLWKKENLSKGKR